VWGEEKEIYLQAHLHLIYICDLVPSLWESQSSLTDARNQSQCKPGLNILQGPLKRPETETPSHAGGVITTLLLNIISSSGII